MVVPEHVFLSHSVQDAEIAIKLSQYLEEAGGIPVWIDSSRLIPGTSDWESAIRDAVARSYAVVVLASPDASASKYVRAELELAEAMGCHIIPVWVRGEKWIDCISFSLSQTQYIDLREDSVNGRETLIQNLATKVAELAPDHYLVAPLWKVSQDRENPGAWRTCPPPGYVAIELLRAADDERTSPFEDPGRAAFVRIATCKTVSHLLDVLFIHYLATDVQPYTYGRDWVLREDHGACGRVLGSWQWVSSIGQDVRQDNRGYRDISLEAAGIVPRSEWRVSRVGSFTPVALAVREPTIVEVLRRSPKAFYALKSEGILTHRPINEVGPEFAHRLVVWFENDWSGELSSDQALVQVRDDPAELQYWLGYWG